MPVTLPAHALAVLPLCRLGGGRWLPPAALVVGSAVPDMAYLWGLGSRISHSPEGLLRFSLPLGLLTLVWLEVLVLPVLRRTAPPIAGVQWARFLFTRGLPRGPRQWALAALAVLIGAATHSLWDGFTHRYRWPASELYAEVLVPLGSEGYPLTHFLQHASSLVGSLVVLALLARRYPHLPEAPGGRWRDFLPVLLPTLVGALGMLLPRLVAWQAGLYPKLQLWWVFWPSVLGGLIGLTLGCLLVRWRAPLPSTS